jgi:L-ribulose-5-phosphate 3-epimerase
LSLDISQSQNEILDKPAPVDPILGLYEKAMPAWMKLEDKIEAAAKAGFDFMEISIDETDERLRRLESEKSWRSSLLTAMRDSGIPIKTMCLSGHRKYPIGSANPDVRKRGLEIMRGAIELASDLGIRIVQIAGYDAYYEPSSTLTRALFMDNLSYSVEIAARYGVMLAIETMETDFANSIARVAAIVRTIDSPYLQIYPDTGNVTNAANGEPAQVREDFLTGKGRIAALHLKESKPGIFREVPYGEGWVDFDLCIASALASGVRIFNAEFWNKEQVEWRAQLTGAGEFLRKKLNSKRHV